MIPQYGKLSSHYKVSRQVILLKLIGQGILKPSDYERMTKKWNETYESLIQKVEGGKDSGGGNYYNTRAVYLGYRFIELAFGKISSRRMFN